MREPCLDYFYGDEVRVDSFCRLPRIFVTDGFYRTVPLEIKFLYGLMLDRVSLSMRNNWREDGRVFIYFTLNDAMRLVHVGRHKAVSLFERMETLGLIRRRKQGRGKPDRIFVREFLEVENAEETSAENAADYDATETTPADIPMETEDVAGTPVAVTEASATPAQIDAPDTCSDAVAEAPAPHKGVVSDLLRECTVGVRRLGDLLSGGSLPEPQTSRNQTSGLPLSGSPDFPKPHPNYIYKRYNELFHYNQSIHQEGTALYEEGDSGQERASRKKKMEYVLKCMKNIKPSVRNIRACALSTLYNAYAVLQRGPVSEKRRKKARKRYGNWRNADE